MLQLEEVPANIINEQFMMNIFSAYERETPPFKECKEHMHAKKNQFKIVRDESKLQPYHLLRKELLTPDDPSNVETDHLIEELGSVLASTLLREFADARKVTHQHLSAIKGKLSWAESSAEEKLAGLGMHANNNASESDLLSSVSRARHSSCQGHGFDSRWRQPVPMPVSNGIVYPCLGNAA